MRDRIGDFERLKIVENASLNLFEEDGKEALDYLTSKRLISLEVLKKFNIGYVPHNLCFKDEKHELAGRIIFPIYDCFDKLVAVSSRDFRNISDRNRGFWHESFSKSHYLFGLNFAKKSIIKKNRAIVIEGETDELRMHSFNFDESVGILGSALSIFHLSMLSRYTDTIYLLFDGDLAGEKSLEKTMEVYNKRNLYQFDFDLIPVRLPLIEGQSKTDPDLYFKSHKKEDMEELLQRSLKDRKNSLD